jgi:Trypsin-like peptidase domain
VVIPPLFSPANPNAPQWASVSMSQGELDVLFRQLVMFYGYDDRTDTVEGLGSGVVVGAGTNQLVVLTTAHGFVEWTDKVSPPVSHALRGLVGDAEDLKARLYRLVLQGRIRAIAAFASGETRFLPIQSISTHSSPRELDCALVQLDVPEEHQPGEPAAIPVDVDPFPLDEPVILAGFPDAQWGGDQTEPFTIYQLQQKLAVVAGYVSALEPAGDRFRCTMFRARIPTLPGMSGGPMLAIRRPPEAPPNSVLPTVAGLVSFGTRDPPEGETLVSPVSFAYHLSVTTLDHGLLPFGECVKRGWISSYGQGAMHLEVEMSPDGRTWTTRYA